MGYLTAELEAFSKNVNSKSLVRPGVSCGIFQDCNANEEVVKPFRGPYKKEDSAL